MGRLRTLTILLTLGAWGAATEGAPPDGAAPATEAASKPPSPVPPVKYLEAGARLFNNGQYDLAAKYVNAAQSYRDQLSPYEQKVLDAYLREIAKAPVDTPAAPAATLAAAPPVAVPVAVAPAPQPAPAPPAVAPARPALAVTEPPAQPMPDPAVTNAVVNPGVAQNAPAIPAPAPPANADAKAQARWLLAAAREQLRAGNYDDASAKVAQARGLNVRYGLFDDTPSKLDAAISQARPKVVATTVADQPKDRRAAKQKLREARQAIEAKQFEQAEAIALDVKSWKLSYGVFEDTPDKVASAARALRHRDAMRNNPKEQSSQGVYDILVQDARHLSAAGRFDEAEAKAKKAQSMNVVPAVTADRAESVLHDIQMARARLSSPKGDQAVAVVSGAAPEAELASARAEREANDMLANGDSKGAALRFAQAETLRAQEANSAPVALAGADGAVAPAPAPVETAPQPGAPAPPAPISRGEQMIAEVKTLYGSGNYLAARQVAEQARKSNLGVESQADEMLSQIALAEQGGALSMYEGAMDAVRKGEATRARALLTEVLAAGDSIDDGLRQKVQGLLDKLSASDATGKATVTDRLAPAEDSDALAAQKLNAEVGTKLAEARRLQDTDPDKAIGIYSQTLQNVKASGLPEQLAKPMVRRLEVALELAKKDKVSFDAKMKDKKFREEIETKRLRILEADGAKKARLKEFLDRAQKAMADGNYFDAEAYALKAQEIDPNDVTGVIIAWKAKAERRMKNEISVKNAKEEGAITAFQGVDWAAVADPQVQMDGIKYMTNFKDLTRERLRMNAKLEPKKDPQTQGIETKLRDQVSVNFHDTPLHEAISFLANYTGLNIVLDPKALADESVTSASPVTLQVSNLPLKNVLRLMLKPLGLTYKLEEGVLEITSPQAAMASVYAKTYYVGDLIMPPKPTNNPTGISNMYNPPGGSGTDSSSTPVQATQMGNGFASMAPHGSSGSNGPTSTHGERPVMDMTPILQLITSSVAPGTWRIYDGQNGQDVTGAYGMGGGFGGAGGDAADTQPIGSITPFYLSISLIIRHTAEIHDQVADLLRQLRRLQDLQVSIEVRFITVSDNFFEQIGVNFDFSIQSKVPGKKSTFATINPAAALFVPGGATTGGTTGTTGGTTTGGSSGTIGGGTTSSSSLGGGGGSSLGGSGGGLGGGSGGSLGGSGSLGGTSGGTGGSTGTGGGSSSATAPAPLIVNPLRDFSLGAGVTTVGQNAGGVGNFTPDLSIPFTQGSAALAVPTNAQPGAGATFGIAFLSDLEVYLFLTAAQGDTRTNILQAPKVTTFNGAPATIVNTEQINFVSSLSPIVGPGSVAFLPQVQSFPNGVVLTVTPVVSADRRYVRMTLSPNFTAIEGFTTIQVPAAVGGSGLGGGSAAINGTIQLPQFTITTVTTTVTVPDGGTVLLGGVKRLNEQRSEFGVPVLSKVPWIDRLFRNVGIGRITSSLMLMVTPRIIILEEEEERLGIPTIAL